MVRKTVFKEAPKVVRLIRRGQTKGERISKRKRMTQFASSTAPRAAQGQQTFLESKAVRCVATRQRYDLAITTFQNWNAGMGLPTTSSLEADVALTDFINFQYFEGGEISEATTLKAAWCDRFPDFSVMGVSRLPKLSRAIQGWSNLEPGFTRPPVPWDIVALIALRLLQMGQPNAALLVCLLFWAYLRPGEGLAMLESDVVPPVGKFRLWAINLHPSFRLDRSKTGLQDHSLLVDGQGAWIGPLLGLLQNSSPFQHLFQLSYAEILRLWDAAQTSLQISPPFVLYQLRHGGPSHDRAFRLRGVAEIKARGGWRSDNSLRRYEAHARLQQVLATFSEDLRARATRATQDLPRLLEKELRQRQKSRGSLLERPPSSSSLAQLGFPKRLLPEACRSTPSTAGTVKSTLSTPAPLRPGGKICMQTGSASSTLASLAIPGASRGDMTRLDLARCATAISSFTVSRGSRQLTSRR